MIPEVCPNVLKPKRQLQESGTLMAAAIAAAEAGATLGELSRALRCDGAEASPSITPIVRARIAEPFEAMRAAADAALAADAEAVVICSTDATYPEIVPALVARIKATRPETMVLLAGYPREDMDVFKEAGIDEFIHVRANCYEINRQLQERMMG